MEKKAWNRLEFVGSVPLRWIPTKQRAGTRSWMGWLCANESWSRGSVSIHT